MAKSGIVKQKKDAEQKQNPEAEKALRKMREFEQRKEKFVAALRKS